LLLVGREFKEKTRFELATASRKPQKGKGGNSPITTLIKVQKIQRGQETSHNGSAILPKDVQMTSFHPKGRIDTILNTRLSGVPKGVDGFPGGHSNLDDGQPSPLQEEFERQSASYIFRTKGSKE
jgi:hypothetical protein